MPYRSAKQRGFLHVHHPKIAARWDKEIHDKAAPKKVSSKKTSSKRGRRH